MAKKISVTLGEHFDQIIEKTVSSGRYSSVTEVLRAGLRKIDEEEVKIVSLREAIEIGEQSGYLKDFDSQKYLAELNKKLTK